MSPNGSCSQVLPTRAGHSRIVVTASVNHVAFNRAIPLGKCRYYRSESVEGFTSSMEIFIDVWIEDRGSGEENQSQ